ncbi:Ribosomal RNA large subunit methyltransferase I [Pirellulimonas nuda]|uniref:Ribosomal RNA large subunit methyltransferase I n=1 Tax=Pirellulimonas nuda TaxID=2528009 RepID=A0A518DB76_9BACT|nr:class I SAM-dependent rRNA methyltransferase [Pirellulimonas nuda]QDU88686.1 Ribosomal RNA large subunit methyltransferase I [Pirellulimonas nuda]
MPSPAQVYVKRGRVKPFFGRHPWVLDTAVERVEGGPSDGDAVDLLTHEGGWIARGVYNAQSRIRVRLWTWQEDQPIDDALLRARIATAIEMRQQIGYDAAAGAARVVYSEADGLSGLVVDRFADRLVVQVGSLAIAQRLEPILEELAIRLAPRGILVRPDRSTADSEGISLEPEWRRGEPPTEPVAVVENGLTYRIDLAAGQKTGFYLDQRENRRCAAAFARGRRVLDLFCYTGGFALNAARAGAAEVVGIDSSAPAIAAAQTAAAENGLANARFELGDGLPTLDSLAARGERFGMVVLDPPKFAKSRKQVPHALKAYAHINRRGLELLEPGGILVTCSCSGSVSREDLRHVLSAASCQAGRPVQILEERGASPDHPVIATCLETDYLKCFVCRVA